MIVYLYGLADGLGDVTGLTGMTGEPLQMLRLDGIAAIAGACREAPPLEAARLAAQDRVVREVHARASALLPMRFGASFSSEADAARAVGLRAASLRARLDLVRGREQMTLRITAVAPRALGLSAVAPQGLSGAEAEAPGASGALGAPRAAGLPAGAPQVGSGAKEGARYLAARARKAAPQPILPMLDAVQSFVRATRIEPGKTAGVIATVYHLIDRGGDLIYRDAIDRACKSSTDLHVLVTGPSPCYAFA